MTDSFLTIEKFHSEEIKITKSRFISQAFPVSSRTEITDYTNDVRKKYYDASHHPYAYRTGVGKNDFKISDDGEPSGSAGKPILEVIDKYNVTNVLLLVSRYFGGTKLGIGGLRRAISEAADLCLSNAVIIERLITEKMNLEFDYTYMNVVMKLIETEKIKLSENNSGEKCKLILEVRLSIVEMIKKDLISITNGNIKIDK